VVRRQRALESQVGDLNNTVDSLTRALKETTARFRTLVQNSTDLTVVVGDAARLSYVSPACRAVLGLDEAELLDLDVMDLVHPDDRATFDAALAAASAAPQTVECRMRHADHTWRGVDVIVIDLRGDATVSGVVLHIRDVTDRRRLEAELRHAQKLESVGQLAAGVAHEINTPIQFIGDNLRFLADAFNQLAAGTAAPDVLADVPVAIEQSLEGVDRVARIVRAMKGFGHAGDEVKVPTDLNEAVRNTVAVTHSEVKHVADVNLYLGEVPPVPCHAGDIDQVLVNLVVNAAQAIGDVVVRTGKRGRITIATLVDGDDAVIQVTDSGPGIPAEIADRVFEPFFTTKEVGVGTGQGLALAYSLVHDRNQGAISFESSPYGGTTFTIHLPLAA
jgi:PAS domain S-box-containing protein